MNKQKKLTAKEAPEAFDVIRWIVENPNEFHDEVSTYITNRMLDDDPDEDFIACGMLLIGVVYSLTGRREEARDAGMGCTAHDVYVPKWMLSGPNKDRVADYCQRMTVFGSGDAFKPGRGGIGYLDSCRQRRRYSHYRMGSARLANRVREFFSCESAKASTAELLMLLEYRFDCGPDRLLSECIQWWEHMKREQAARFYSSTLCNHIRLLKGHKGKAGKLARALQKMDARDRAREKASRKAVSA